MGKSREEIRQTNRVSHKRRYDERCLKGLCTYCGKPSRHNKIMCQVCTDKAKKYNKKRPYNHDRYIQYRQRGKDYVDSYKISKGCQRCGYRSNDSYLFDMHHIEKKSFVISQQLHSPLTTLKKEAAKCKVLCSRCHRHVHNGKGL